MIRITLLLLIAPWALAAQASPSSPVPPAAGCCEAEASPEHSIWDSSFAGDVITGEQIERLAPTSLPELLAFIVPGVYSLDEGVRNELYRAIRIRGTAAVGGCPGLPSSRDWTSLACPSTVGNETCLICGPKILIDGIEVGGAALGAIDIHNVERIEVLRGPAASVPFGVDAATGVIHIHTRQGPSAGGGRLRVAAGAGLVESPYTDQSGRSSSVAATLGGNIERFAFSLGASHRDDGGFVSFQDSRASALSVGYQGAFGDLSISGSTRWSQRRLKTLGWAAAYYDLYADGLLPSWGARISPDAFADHRNVMTSLALRYQHRPGWSSGLTVGQDQLDLDAENAPRLAEGDSLKLLEVEEWTSQTARVATSAQALLRATSLKVEAGGDLRTRRIQGFDSYHRLTGEPQVIHSRGDIRDERRTEGGIFMDGELSRGGFRLAAGVRAANHTDFPEGTDWKFLHRVGAGYNQSVGGWVLRPRFSYATGLTVPAAYMISGVSPSTEPNYGLEPQTTRGWDLGADLVGLDGGVRISAAHFSQTTSDALGSVGVLASGDSVYLNSGSISNVGEELQVTVDQPAFAVRTVVTRLRNRVREMAGEPDGVPVRFDPSPELVLGSELTLRAGGLVGRPVDVRLAVNHLGRRWANDRRAVIESLGTPQQSFSLHRWFDPITRVDAGATAGVSRNLEVRVEVLNLFDNVTPEVPEIVVPGRQLRAQLSASW